jgi:aromatase
VAGHTDNSIVIDAPRDFVWERMMDVESWPTLYTEYSKAEILSRDGNTIQFRLTTHPDPEYGGQVWSWVSERTADPETYTSQSHRIETGPFEYMKIRWSFEESPEGTVMRWIQDFSMKPTAPNDDEKAEEYLNRNTKIQMDVLKEKLEREAKERAR